LTISFQVTSATAGVFCNGPAAGDPNACDGSDNAVANGTVDNLVGLNAPGNTDVQFKDSARIAVNSVFDGQSTGRVNGTDQVTAQLLAGGAVDDANAAAGVKTGDLLSDATNATTAGSGTAVTDGTGTTGTTIVDPNATADSPTSTYLVTEAPADGTTTNLQNYYQSVTCADSNATTAALETLPAGAPLDGGLTVAPLADANIACTITNTPIDGSPLKVHKTFVSATGWQPGDTLTYQVQVANTGSSTMKDVVVTDAPGTGLDAGTATWVAPLSAGTANGDAWDIDAIAPGPLGQPTVLTADVTVQIAAGTNPLDAMRNTAVAGDADQAAPDPSTVAANDTVGADTDAGDYVDVTAPHTSLFIAKMLLNASDAASYLDGSAWSVLPGLDGDTPGADTGVTVTESPTQAGLFQVDNLIPGNYTLTETTAPAGYNLLATPVPFTVNPDLSVTVDTETSGNAVTTSVDPDTHLTTITVYDVAMTLLPLTGGSGNAPFVAGGVALLVTAVALGLIARRRPIIGPRHMAPRP
ncbi:MAG: SpaA isopeptide-forming pilin-related protein, partial [Micrococcales bacterium]|nr:SpaA isopeptide-forming pilin-related protein [Micrococcales bacterium]